MRAALAGGHVVLLRRPACLDILAAIVINLPRPLKGVPALNEFEPKRPGRRVEKLHNGQLRAIHPLIYVPLVCRHSRRLSVFIFNAHIWQL